MPVQQATYAVPRSDLGEAFREFAPEGQNFIAEQIFPVRGVIKKAATLSVIRRENLKRHDTKHSNGGAFNRIDLTTEDLSYKCEDTGLEVPVTDDDRENYSSDFECELESTQVLKQAMLMEREVRVKDVVLNTSTFNGATLYTDVSSAPWATATSDVIAHVVAAKEKVRIGTGMTPNALILGQAAMCTLLYNTKITGRFPGAAIVTEEMIRQQLAAIFGLTKLIVGGVVYDGAKEGQTFSGSDVWGSTYAMVAKIQEGSTKVNGGLGRSIVWTPMDQGVDSIVEYREEQTESYIYRSREYRQEKIFEPSFGHLLKIN